jgi:glycogen(starch) synthase
LHIAFVTPESPYGDAAACGIASYLRAIIPAIVDARHHVTVLAKSTEEKIFMAEGGRVSVHHFRLPSLHWYSAKLPLIRNFAPLPLRQFEWSFGFYREVARLHAQQKIDIIESTEAGSLFLSRIAPVVIRLHGSELTFRKYSGMSLTASIRCNEALESYAGRRAAAITAPGRFQADEIVRRRAWSKERVRVIPNPISESLLKAAAGFHRNGHHERTVLYTGRLAPVKGIDTLLKAAKLVHAKDPSITFVLAGPWQMPEAPPQYGLQLNQRSPDGIQWVGPQNQSQLIEWYKRAALFVMPSYYESFGISPVEAMAFGVPVVASDTSGLAEVIGSERLTSLVPKGDAGALAQTIVESMRPENGRSANPEAPQATIDRLQPARIAAETLAVYQAVLHGSRK